MCSDRVPDRAEVLAMAVDKAQGWVSMIEKQLAAEINAVGFGTGLA